MSQLLFGRKPYLSMLGSQFRRRPTWLWLLLLTTLAIILRLMAIGRDSLWLDEAISFLAATLPASSILDNTVQSSHPPLYYLLLHLWRQWVPDSDVALRLVGLFWNVLLVPAIYLLVKALLDRRRLALIAAALVTISPFHILYSHELRMYTQLMFLVTTGTLAYWRARQDHRWRYWLLFGFLFLAAVYTHLFAFLALAGIGLHALIYYKTERRVLVRTALVILLIVVLFLPWAIMVVAESQKELGSLRPLAQDRGLNPIKPLTSMAFLIFGLSDNLPYSAVAFFLTLAITVVLLMEVRRILREGVPSGLVLLALMGFCLLGVPILIYLIRPFFLPERTMAAASPFLLILLAWSTTRRRSPLPFLVYATAVVMFVGSLLYLLGDPVKPPYRDAIQFVAQHRTATDAVLHTSDGSYLPALSYVDFPRHAVLAGDPDPRKPVSVYEALGGEVWTPEQAVDNSERLWLVVALEHSVEWQLEQVDYFNERYVALEQVDFAGIAVYLYDLSGTETETGS